MKKADLENFAIFAGKQLCWSLFILKCLGKIPVLESLYKEVAGENASNFIKQRLQHRYCPVNIAKFLRTPILKNICKGLLLDDKIPFYFFHTETDFLFVQEDSFGLTGVFL